VEQAVRDDQTTLTDDEETVDRGRRTRPVIWLILIAIGLGLLATRPAVRRMGSAGTHPETAPGFEPSRGDPGFSLGERERTRSGNGHSTGNHDFTARTRGDS
jgi:hypothetical protein